MALSSRERLDEALKELRASVAELEASGAEFERLDPEKQPPKLTLLKGGRDA